MFGFRLKTLRQQNGYTIAQICSKMNLSTSSYTKYERDEREMNLETLTKFADFYGVTTDYLLGRDSTDELADPIDELVRERNLTPLERKILEEYMALPDKARANVMDFLKKAVAEKEKNNHGGD